MTAALEDARIRTEEGWALTADPTRMRIAAARAQQPERFDWRRESYEFVVEPIAIDLLYGSGRERQLLETGPTPGELDDHRALWSVDEAEFRDRRSRFLLYG